LPPSIAADTLPCGAASASPRACGGRARGLSKGRDVRTRTWRQLLQRLRPRTLLGYWSTAAFLLAVARLLLIRGLNAGSLILFLFPPLMALVFRGSDRRSTRVMAALFLTLIDFGVLIGPIPWLFPGLQPIDRGLSATDNRVLAWYVGMYIFYLFVLLPPLIFGRGLLRRYRRKGDFSTFTNVLGLVAWVIMGLPICCLSFTRLGLWPPIRW